MKVNLQKGIGLVEVIIGTVIASIVLFALLATTQNFIQLSRETLQVVRGSYVLEEGFEITRILRDRSWNSEIGSFATDGTEYYFVFDGDDWQSTTTETYIDGFFLRKATFEDVYRDASDKIAESGSLDPDTVKVNITVEWPSRANATSTRSASSYITNFFNE